MNRCQKYFLMVCLPAFAACAGRVFAGPDSLPDKLLRTTAYWLVMGIVFYICWTQLKRPMAIELEPVRRRRRRARRL